MSTLPFFKLLYRMHACVLEITVSNYNSHHTAFLSKRVVKILNSLPNYILYLKRLTGLEDIIDPLPSSFY